MPSKVDRPSQCPRKAQPALQAIVLKWRDRVPLYWTYFVAVAANAGNNGAENSTHVRLGWRTYTVQLALL